MSLRWRRQQKVTCSVRLFGWTSLTKDLKLDLVIDRPRGNRTTDDKRPSLILQRLDHLKIHPGTSSLPSCNTLIYMEHSFALFLLATQQLIEHALCHVVSLSLIVDRSLHRHCEFNPGAAPRIRRSGERYISHSPDQRFNIPICFFTPIPTDILGSSAAFTSDTIPPPTKPL